MARLGKIGLCAVAALVAFMVTMSVASAASYGVMAWGANKDGELGDGNLDRVDHAVTLHELVEVTAISAGGYFSLALLANHTVNSWGDNTYGQLGDGKEGGHSAVPVEAHGLSGVSALSAGESHSLALTEENGEVLAWGENSYGQLGIGTTKNHDEPVSVGLKDVIAVAAGADFSLALLNTGHVVAWGDNEVGELGDGTTTGPEKWGLLAVWW